MYQYLAYVPYAFAAACTAKAMADVWPTLRSQLGDVSHYSSRHGMDGEHYGPRFGTTDAAAEFCPPWQQGGAIYTEGGYDRMLRFGGRRARNAAPLPQNSGMQRFAASQAGLNQYCYDESTGEIVGKGPLNGVKPLSTQVAVYEQGGLRMASIDVSGDDRMEIPTCDQPSGVPVSVLPPGGDPLPPPPTRKPPRDVPTPPGVAPDPCDPRFPYRHVSPTFRQSDCGNRMRRVANRRMSRR